MRLVGSSILMPGSLPGLRTTSRQVSNLQSPTHSLPARTFLSLSVALPLCATGSFASMDCAGNARLHTKIDFLDLFVALKVGRLALDGDATGLQNVSIVGDAERKRDRLLGEQ